MMLWLQLWRNTFFRIFDIEHLRNGKRHRHNSFTVAVYSTKAFIWPHISIFARNFFFFEISRKVVRCWKRLGEQNSDHYSKMKISHLVFEISSKMCEPKVKFNTPSRCQLWRHDCIYDVMNFFEFLTSKISGTESDTDIICLLLQSTPQRLSSGVLFQ